MKEQEQYRGGLLSTLEFAEELNRFDVTKGIGTYRVDLDPYLFIQLVHGTSYEVVLSPDGAVGKVQEAPQIEGKFSNTRSSKFFDLHKDGLSYHDIPQLVFLHCVNEGTQGIPTFFVDSSRIIEQLDPKDLDQLRKLEMVYARNDGTVHIHPFIKPHSQTGEPVIYIWVLHELM